MPAPEVEPKRAIGCRFRTSGAIDLAAVFEFVELGGSVALRDPIIRPAAALQLFDLRTEPDEVQQGLHGASVFGGGAGMNRSDDAPRSNAHGGGLSSTTTIDGS